MKSTTNFPPGWDEDRVSRLLQHYESMSEGRGCFRGFDADGHADSQRACVFGSGITFGAYRVIRTIPSDPPDTVNLPTAPNQRILEDQVWPSSKASSTDASPRCWGVWLPSGNVRGENKGAFQGNQKQPDILVTQTGAQPVVIENEYLPAHTVEGEARDRLGERLDASVVQATGRVNAVVALRSPVDLHDCAGLDDVDALLKQGVTLEYALFTGASFVDFTRFPKSGFIRGNIRDLAAFVDYAATPEDAVQRAVMILEEGVQDAAAISATGRRPE